MTTGTKTVRQILNDAQSMHEDSLRLLSADDIRDAAEKAWCATRTAAIALVLFETGEEPSNSTQVSAGFRGLNSSFQRPHLKDTFGANARFLHSDCFYNGNCEPIEETADRINKVADFISAVRSITGE